MIKNVLPSLRQRAGPQRICSRQKSIRSGTARDSFSQTPHMRGKVLHAAAAARAGRITPAYAGKRLLQASDDTRGWDHPRTCGEKFCPGVVTNSIKGSPPHVQGKGKFHYFVRGNDRITPACAGKSHTGRFPARSTWDHPRMCGEKLPASVSFRSFSGSPPHVRGKVFLSRDAQNFVGITPAYAGKSRWCARGLTRARDHPRMCGEKNFSLGLIFLPQGSPPRMRGKAQVRIV